MKKIEGVKKIEVEEDPERALVMKQLAQQIKDSNGDLSSLEGSPLLSPKGNIFQIFLDNF